MRLKSQVQLILLGTSALFLCLTFLVFNFVISPSFKKLEKSKARIDLQRGIEALDREAHHLALAIHDWASWDETYEYIVDHNKDYEKYTFGEDIFATTDFDLIYYIDAAGRIVWSGVSEPSKGERQIRPPFPKEPWPENYFLNMISKEDISASGIMLLDNETAMIIAAAQILTTDVKGPCRGTVVMGRLLNDKIITKLTEQTHVDLQVWPVPSERIPEEQGCSLVSLEPGEKCIVENPDKQFLDVYTTYQGMDGKKVILLRARVPKEITEYGQKAIHIALGMVVLAGAITAIFTIIFIQNLILRPLERLTRQLGDINTGDDLSIRVTFERKDEIGILSNAFNKMMNCLEEDSIEKKKLFDEIEQISKLDGLTGLANRRTFDSALDKNWRRAIRSGTSLSLLLIDVDHFKLYNDFYGHLKGDDVLRRIGATLETKMRRPYDLPARFGGEEFVILLPEIDNEHAFHLAELIRKTIELLEIPHEKSETASYVTVSIGVGTIVPTRESNLTQFLTATDQALYIAKKEGRNRVSFINQES